MKKFSEKLSYLFLTVFIIIFIAFYNSSQKYQEKLRAGIANVKSKMLSKAGKEEYLSQILELGFSENGRMINTDTAYVYQLAEKEKKDQRNLRKVLTAGKKKLIIRYTEIGCDACTDSIFTIINQYPEIRKKYNVMILIDFSNYDSYLKWRKISVPRDSVLWLRKGDLPLEIEESNRSYIFTSNSLMELNDFFIPNSIFPSFIHTYLQKLQSK